LIEWGCGLWFEWIVDVGLDLDLGVDVVIAVLELGGLHLSVVWCVVLFVSR
jgi:hypothetical protein